MKNKLLVMIILGILLLPIISADCTITLDQDLYSQEAVATATMICSAPAEQSQSYTLNWTNSTGHVIESDTGTTPATKNSYFYDTYTIDSSYVATYGTQLNITLTGTVLEGTDNSTVASAGTTDLVITEISVIPDFYIGSYGAVQFDVEDSSGNKIANAQCVIDIVNGHDLPIVASGREIPSQGNGEVLYSFFLPKGTFYEDEDYKIDIACTCFNTTGFTSNGIGYCFESTGAQIDSFKNVEAQYPFSITDIADKMVINQTVDITLGTGIWVENEHGYRVNTTASLAVLYQDDINWNNYADADGQAFLTAGEKFRTCMYVNNTFDGLEHIMMTDLHLLRQTGYMVHTLCMDDSKCEGKEVMHTSIQSGNYKKCSDWVKVPSYIKGQNNYKVNFHIQVEGYEQNFIAYSDRFTIFGEKEDTDYLDYLVINNVSFTKSNVSEGEYIQLKINITNNHLTKDIEAKLHIEFDSNEGGNERKIKPIPYNLNNWVAQDSVFGYDKLFDANEENIILTPRFKVPYGLKDIDLFDVISADFSIHVLDDKHGEILYTQFWTGADPTINVPYYDFEITNLSLTIADTSVSACSVYTANLSYNNEISDTDGRDSENQRFIIRGCTEDTTNDLYLHCSNFEIQPDEGISKLGTFTTTLPYTTSNIEAEMDIFVYSFDPTNLDENCYHCGELIDSFSGDEGDAVYNITVNSADSCRYSKYGISGRDDILAVEFRQAEALEGIETKTGTFHLDVDCPPYGTIGRDMSCTIIAYIEDPQTVQKEVDFTCHISDGISTYSSINFNQMITKNPISISRDFTIPSTFSNGQQYVLQCHADYYNLGSRRDSFYDTFTATISPSSGLPERGPGITGGVIDEGEDKGIKEGIIDIIKKFNPFGPDKNWAFIFIEIITLAGILVMLIIAWRNRKKQKTYTKCKQSILKRIFQIILILIAIATILFTISYLYNNIKAPNLSSIIIQDSLIRDFILIGFFVLMAIIIFKLFNIRGEIRFGNNHSTKRFYEDRKTSKLQHKINQQVLKNELKRHKGKTHHIKIRKYKR